MKPATPKVEPPPSTRLLKAVFEGSHVPISRTSPFKTVSTARHKHDITPLHDTTPLTVSVEGDDGRVIVIFNRNTIIPARASLILPNRAKESIVGIKVVQGEYSVASKNHLLVEFVINDLLPASGGDPQVAVTFDIDVTGILHVSAKGLATGNEHKVFIKRIGQGLSTNDIQQHLSEAEVLTLLGTRAAAEKLRLLK